MANSCDNCGGPTCERQGVIARVLGAGDGDVCLECLGQRLGASPEELAQLVGRYLSQRECYRRQWRRAAPCAVDTSQAACCPSRLERSDAPPAWFRPELFRARPEDQLPEPALTVDTEEAGCGDLMVLMMRSIRRIPPGELLEVIARDPGAPEDIPSWCRLTGHELLAGPTGPEDAAYFVRRKPHPASAGAEERTH